MTGLWDLKVGKEEEAAAVAEMMRESERRSWGESWTSSCAMYNHHVVIPTVIRNILYMPVVIQTESK